MKRIFGPKQYFIRGYIAIVIIFIVTIPAFTQIALEWEMLPQTDGDNLNVPYDKTNVTANDLRINLGLPVVLTSTKVDSEQVPTTLLINNLFYSSKHLDVNNWPEYSSSDGINIDLELKEDNSHLVSFGYTAMLMRKLNEQWMLLGTAGFTYAAVDPDKYKLTDMGVILGAAALREMKSGWSAGFGLYYGRITGVSQALPLLIVQKETKKYTLNITLPSEISYWYLLNKKISIGLKSKLEGDMYTFQGIKLNQYDKNGQLVSSNNKVGLAYSAITFGPIAKISLGKGIAAIIQTGIAFTRRYQYWVPDEGEVLRHAENSQYITLTGHDYSGEKVEFPMENTVFVKLALGLGL